MSVVDFSAFKRPKPEPVEDEQFGRVQRRVLHHLKVIEDEANLFDNHYQTMGHTPDPITAELRQHVAAMRKLFDRAI